MAAIVNVDMSNFLSGMDSLVAGLADTNISVRPIAVEMVGIMHKRIHTDGKDSAGNQIGTYSPGYLKMRQRKPYNHNADSRIIAVLTRKLSNSWTAFPTPRGWAVGFVDDSAADGVTSLKKLQYLEQMKGKKILELTDDELQYTNERIIEIATTIIQQFNQQR